jgi:hypothetical protein
MPAPDFTDKYNTKLSKDDEAKFQSWAEQSGHAGDTRDYDMRGWWKKNGSNGQTDERGHFTDEFKKPNHPTFSDESKYDGADGNKGGKWGGTDDAPTFTPSQTNLKNMSADELQDYFSKVEPDSKLVLPQSKGAKAPMMNYSNPAPSDVMQAR